MSLYTLKAKVTVRVPGISGPFEQVVAWHIHAEKLEDAKYKFEQHVKRDNANADYNNIKFQYVEIIGEIL